MKVLTKGNPLKLILLFAIPLAIGQLFQLGYSLVDTRIVGEILGENALAAVGGTSTLSDVLINLMMGITNGFAIIVATSFGAGDEKRLKRAVSSIFVLTAIIVLILTAFCGCLLSPILHLINVPGEIYTDAKGYISIIIYGLLCTAMYNACAGILRAIGDTVTPLVFLIISSFLNVGLDYGFILGLHMGVFGAALATIISQGLSAVLCFVYMWMKYPIIRFGRADLCFESSHIWQMLKNGLSMGFMSAFVSFGTLALQSAINVLGTDIIVAHTAARKVTTIFMLPFSVFGQALATYCGQNMGAGEYGRIRKGIVQTTTFTWGWCVLMIVLAYTVSPVLIKLITASDNLEIIKYGSLYLKVDTIFYFVPTVIALVRNSLQGIGDSVTPVVSSSIEFVGKVLIAAFLAPLLGYWGIIIAEPIVWVLMVIPLVMQFFKNPVLMKKE